MVAVMINIFELVMNRQTQANTILTLATRFRMHAVRNASGIEI